MTALTAYVYAINEDHTACPSRLASSFRDRSARMNNEHSTMPSLLGADDPNTPADVLHSMPMTWAELISRRATVSRCGLDGEATYWRRDHWGPRFEGTIVLQTWLSSTQNDRASPCGWCIGQAYGIAFIHYFAMEEPPLSRGRKLTLFAQARVRIGCAGHWRDVTTNAVTYFLSLSNAPSRVCEHWGDMYPSLYCIHGKRFQGNEWLACMICCIKEQLRRC